MIIKRSVQQEYKIIINLYAKNVRTSKYINQILGNQKGEIDNTIKEGHWNTLLSIVNKSSTQKMSVEALDLNYTLEQMDITDIFRTFLPTAAECIFFWCSHRTFSRVDHMLGHKTRFNKFKKIEIISSIFSNHSGMKLEINNRRKMENSQICGN